VHTAYIYNNRTKAQAQIDPTSAVDNRKRSSVGRSGYMKGFR